MNWSIEDRHVLITGGTSGIGRATATALARLGANVTITSRNLATATQAADEIGRESATTVTGEEVDLSSLASVRALAGKYATDQRPIDLLINNAGTMAARRQTTRDGLEWTMAVNYFGPFLLTNLLLDRLISRAPSRIISVSSENHRGAKRGIDFDDLQMTTGFTPSKAYAASKLANILFTVELDRRFSDEGITARALHPGVVATEFGTGPDSPKRMAIAMRLLKPFLSTPAKGAATSVHLATAPQADLEAGIYWSNQKPRQPSPTALDADAARRLWDVSAALVGPAP
jgi:NAD(P)-dependent dehydrogenase (short-subunit alcohol dehydrogenase family)